MPPERAQLFEQVYQICDEQGVQWFEVVFFHYRGDRNASAYELLRAVATDVTVIFWNDEPAASLPPDQQLLSFWNDRGDDVGLRVMHATIDGVPWSFERVMDVKANTDTLRMYDGGPYVLMYRDKDGDKQRFMRVVELIERLQDVVRAEACYIGYGYLHKPEDRCDL